MTQIKTDFHGINTPLSKKYSIMSLNGKKRMNHNTQTKPPRRGFFIFLCFATALLFADCSASKDKEETAMAETEGFGPIDIPSSDFFWLIQPWKEGKLATIDGWGRFAEISFIGTNKIQIKPLVEFPRAQFDRRLITWPKAGLIAATTGKMQHLAAVDDKKTKSHLPLLSWVHSGARAVLLDPSEGLVGYNYLLTKNDNDVDVSLFVYNYKEDRMVYESPGRGFFIYMEIAIDAQYVLSSQRSFNGDKRERKIIFFNWRIGEVAENDLTEALNNNRVTTFLRPRLNINLERRYLFCSSNITRQKIKVAWDEKYSDVTVTPLSYLLPEGKYFGEFILSANGQWATTLVNGYRGLLNEQLEKRAFFHLDERYPNGISMPIMAEDYERPGMDYSAFVEHPVHGMCFAQEWHKMVNDKDRLYLRLYRMDGVLDEINQQLLEKAEEPVK
jgi:hypothetical protein